MKQQHTNGPWRVSQGGKFIQHCIPGTISNICEMSPLNGDGEGHDVEPLPSQSSLMEARAERKANATLIASAPDLLEALKNLLSEFLSRTALIESCDMDEDEEAAIEAAESAISKATNTTP